MLRLAMRIGFAKWLFGFFWVFFTFVFVARVSSSFIVRTLCYRCMRTIAYVFGEGKPEGYFSFHNVTSPFFIMGRVSVAYLKLFLFGFTQQSKMLLVFPFSEFCKPIQHRNFLWDLSQANNKLPRSVNTQFLNSLPHIVLFQ